MNIGSKIDFDHINENKRHYCITYNEKYIAISLVAATVLSAIFEVILPFLS